MKKLLLSSLAGLILTTGSALAADLYTPPPVYKAAPPPPPAVSWTGCYIDGGGGYGLWNQDHYSETNPGLVPFSISTTDGGRGWLGRLGGGCDYQFGLGGLGNFVIGAFGDYDFMNLKGTNQPANDFVFPPAIGAPIAATNVNESDAWYVGGRLGYLVTPTLLTYFDGGYTETRFDAATFAFSANGAPVPFGLPATTYHGWFLGGGTEYALNFSWLPISGLFWRTEYRYAQYQAQNVPIVPLTATAVSFAGENIKPYVQTITTSLVWRFNFGGPVAARY